MNHSKIKQPKMSKTIKHTTKKWEVSIMEFENHTGKKLKATRKIPAMCVAETKIFNSKEDALKQFDEWLN